MTRPLLASPYVVEAREAVLEAVRLTVAAMDAAEFPCPQVMAHWLDGTLIVIARGETALLLETAVARNSIARPTGRRPA